MKTLMQKGILFFTVILLAGCGWHMRGSGSESTTHVKALNVASSHSRAALERAIRTEMHIQHIEEGGNDAWTVTILDQKIRQNLLAYSDSINAAMIEVEYVVRFSVTNEKGETIIAPNAERVVRTYEPNANRALATDREASLMKTEVYNEMAANILRRINFSANKQHSEK